MSVGSRVGKYCLHELPRVPLKAVASELKGKTLKYCALSCISQKED